MTKDLTLKFQRFPQSGANGDRATTSTDYFSYKIVLKSSGSAGNGFVVKEFSGYDHFYCHVLDQEDTRVNATRYAHAFAAVLGLEPPHMAVMEEKTVATTQWVERTI